MLVQIPDALYLKLKKAADAADRATTPEQLIARQLQRFGDFPVTVRTVLVAGDDLEALETTLGGGQVKDGADLLKKVHQWAGITIGNIRVDFSPAQLDEIAHRAEKQGKDPQTIVDDIVRQIAEQFFWTPVVAR